MRKIFAVAALLSSSQLIAQTDTSGQTLNEVIVTANKVPQKQNTTGKVISVIGKEMLEKSAGRTLTQLLNEQAGLTINGALNNLGANQTVYMRGAASGRTLILIDGMPVNDPTMINNEFDLNFISLNNVERIEICKGAQSTLYGSDAVAGVINIITTKTNITKPFNAKATLSAGSLGTYKGNAQVYGKVGKLTYTTRYSKLVSDGFSAANDKDKTKNFDKDGYNGDAAYAAAQLQATEALNFRTFAQYSRYKTDIDNAAFTDENDYTITNKSWIAGGGFRYTKNAINLVGNYQFSTANRDYLNDSADVAGFAKFTSDNYEGKNQFVELYANIGLTDRFTLLQGADFRYSEMYNKLLSVSSFGPYSPKPMDTAHSQSSIYSSLRYSSLNQKLNIELGGRLNVHSRYGSNYTYTFNPSYSIGENYRVFGSIATGFKAPTLYQLYSSAGERNLKPEESKTYELGVQHQHAKVQSRLVYFKRNIKNGLDFDYNRFKYFNAFRQKAEGIEAETRVTPFKNFTLSANYTFIKGKETTQNRATFKDTTYNYFLRRPEHNLNVTAGYQFANGLYVSATGKYVNDRMDAGAYQTPDVRLDSYFLLGAYAEYKIKSNFKVFADAQNITDKRFFDVRGYNSIPFLLNGGVTFEW